MRQFPSSPITALIDEKPLYNLGESTATDLTLAELLGPGDPPAPADPADPADPAELAELAELADLSLGYGTSAGDPGLRALVAARTGVPDSQVLITSGAAAALFLVALLCGGDGETLVGRPCYPPTVDALRGIGATIVTVGSRFEDGYRVDLDAFGARLSSRTRLVMFASPQNPSGVSLTEGEVEQMLALMSRSCPDALLLIDETFREATYGGAAPAASFAGTSPRLLTCASLSKAYGAPGLRVGWLTVPDPGLYDQFRLAKFNSALSCGALDEFLAGRLLARADEVLAARGAVLADSLGIVERWVKAQAGRLSWLPPDAGAFCCLQLDPGAFGGPAIGRFHDHLTRRRTLVARGPWFGDGPDIVRLGFAHEPAGRLERGLDIIGEALDAGLNPALNPAVS
ncbi:MAG TPA: pyridoxal phosphate-dependent aminotransferase [Streptosporangiaceae bacterium]|nr:pyridoxal phosphate-dependent aminotransferase [Streptosporangiaceae bacterium]